MKRQHNHTLTSWTLCAMAAGCDALGAAAVSASAAAGKDEGSGDYGGCERVLAAGGGTETAMHDPHRCCRCHCKTEPSRPVAAGYAGGVACGRVRPWSC